MVVVVRLAVNRSKEIPPEVYLDSRNLTLEIRGGRSGTSGGGKHRELRGFSWWQITAKRGGVAN